MRNLLREWQAELKQTFTGTRDAVPEWVGHLAEGDDAGYHLPGSAVWAVHGGMQPSSQASALDLRTTRFR